MEELMIRLLIGRVYITWAPLNIDIDPFVVVLDREGKIVIAMKGNFLASDRGGSFEESYRRARMALNGKRPKGGSRIYWLDGRPKYRRIFMGAIGVSGLRIERDHPFARRFAGFRGGLNVKPPLIYDLDLQKHITIPPELSEAVSGP